ncbi:MAG TPA: ABC transporter ATP-binding protein [Myxococcota bacterium]|nr:ABC transporter ATP-binding protein [Myxococcota bacterium]
MSELEAAGLVKRFQLGDTTIQVLAGVNLLLRPGESLAVLGVSGAGKSTLLHVLGGLERPTEGSVRFGGRDLYALPPEDVAAFRNRSLGFVFQSHHLLPEFDALENVTMPCLLAGLPRRQARDQARAMLDSVGLSHRLHHNPGKLSGGERQRVAIARALVMSPAVVLADEPTGNLDPHTADDVIDLFLRLNAEARTALVLVTHNEKLANRLAKKRYLVEGRLES